MKSKKRRMIYWVMTIWAILIGCVVSDLFVCPWTEVFTQSRTLN